ncbi:hypothetical protein AB2J02_12405 [Escherichia coli]
MTTGYVSTSSFCLVSASTGVILGTTGLALSTAIAPPVLISKSSNLPANSGDSFLVFLP